MSTHRPTCSGSNAGGYLGGCYQHRRTSEQNVPLFQNVTKVTDYHNPADPAGTAPYPRQILPGSFPSCAAGDDCGDGSNGLPFCEYWDTGSIFACATPSSSSVTVNVSGFRNCYELVSGSFVDYSSCRKIGFKNVQAQKVWHGAWPFDSHMRCAYDEVTKITPVDPLYAICFSGPPLILTPESNKFLSSYVSCVFTSDIYGNGSILGTGSVDRHTGNHSCTVSVDTGSLSSGDADRLLTDFYGLQGMSKCSVETFWFNLTFILDNNTTLYPNLIADDSRGLRWDFADDPPTGHFSKGHCFYDDGVCEYRDENENGVYTEILGVSGNSGWHIVEYVGVTGNYRSECRINQMDSYPWSEVWNDCKSLLERFPLNDDKIYPWRTDAFTTVAPKLRYNESGPSVPTLSIPCEIYTASLYDGSVIGIPNPAGFDSHFDYQHDSYGACGDTESGTEAFYIRYHGAASGRNIASDITDQVVPKSATAWTENLEACNLYPQANWTYQNGYLHMQKYAEVLLRWPSHNYARPCGADLYEIDELGTACIESITDKTITLYSGGSTGSFNTGDKIMVCGADDLNGIWDFTRGSSHEITLTTPLVSGSQFRSDRECFSGIVGKVRFPTAPAICGEVEIFNASNNIPITLSLAQSTYLYDNASVIVEGVTGNTAANGTFNISVIDDSTIVLLGSSGNGAYSGSGVIRSPSGASEYWNDAQPKGQYLVKEYQYDFRDYQASVNYSSSIVPPDAPCQYGQVVPTIPRIYQEANGLDPNIKHLNITQACLPFKACCPSVVCISPNGETWSNGITYNFTEFTGDETFGSTWLMQVQQWNTDPLWQAPSKPCTCNQPFKGAWRQDLGGCTEDTTLADCDLEADDQRYYAFPPIVESSQLPVSAPSLPSGLYVGCLTQTEIDIAGTPAGNICQPELVPGRDNTSGGANYPKVHTVPWVTYLNELACVCNEGRFLTEYEQSGVFCAHNNLIDEDPP